MPEVLIKRCDNGTRSEEGLPEQENAAMISLEAEIFPRTSVGPKALAEILLERLTSAQNVRAVFISARTNLPDELIERSVRILEADGHRNLTRNLQFVLVQVQGIDRRRIDQILNDKVGRGKLTDADMADVPDLLLSRAQAAN